MDNQQHQPSRAPWDSPTAAELAQMQRAAAPHSRAEEGEVQSVRLSGVKEAGSGQEKQQSQQHYYTPVKQVGSGGKKRARDSGAGQPWYPHSLIKCARVFL